MADMEDNIAAFEKMLEDLQRNHMGKWVLFHENKLEGIYDSFEKAAMDATARFGRGPFLIRQVGAVQITLPASVAFFTPAYA